MDQTNTKRRIGDPPSEPWGPVAPISQYLRPLPLSGSSQGSNLRRRPLRVPRQAPNLSARGSSSWGVGRVAPVAFTAGT